MKATNATKAKKATRIARPTRPTLIAPRVGPKPKEFTLAKPLVIEIKQENGTWTILPHAKHHPKIRQRLNEADPVGGNLEGRIIQEYRRRKTSRAPNDPNFIREPHPPVIVREGEFVQFVCDPPFAFRIWSHKDG